MRFLKFCLLGSALAFGGLAVATLPPAAHAEVPAKAFGELPSVYDAAISPDGTRVAAFVNIDGTYGIAIFDLESPGAEPVGVLLGKGLKPEWVAWANRERVLASVWQSSTYGNTPITTGAIFTIDATDGDAKQLITPPRNASTGSNIGKGRVFEQFLNDVVDMLPDDSEHILMTFADERQFKRGVHKVDVETGRYTTIDTGNTNVQRWETDLTGELRVQQGLRNSADSTESDEYFLRVRDAATGEWIRGDNLPGIENDVSIYGFTSNPNEMIVGMRRGKDTRGLYIYDLTKRAVGRKLYHNDDYDVSGIEVEDGEVIGARFIGGETTEVALFDGYDSTMDAIRAKFAGSNVDFVDSSDGGESVLISVSSAYDPGALIMVKDGGASLENIASIRPSLPSDEMGLVVPVRYTARDGAKIPAYVTLPPTVNDTSGIKDLPFIVLPHGGPFARDAAEFDYFAQFFASRGYGVLQMNFRGSTGYGEAYAKAGREDWEVMTGDVEDGTRWLIEKGYADPDRLCVAGWSYGGYAALMGGLETPELYQCVVAIAALSDIPGAIRQARDYRFGKFQKGTFMEGFDDKSDMKANSPALIADQMTLPTFIAHGRLDQRVQYDQHQKLHRALKKSPARVVEMNFKNEDHFMSQQKNRQKMLEGIDKFLVSVNGPSEFVKK